MQITAGNGAILATRGQAAQAWVIPHAVGCGSFRLSSWRMILSENRFTLFGVMR